MYNHKWCKDNFGVGGILAYLLPSFNIVLVSVSFVGEFHYLLYILPTLQTKVNMVNVIFLNYHIYTTTYSLKHHVFDLIILTKV